MCSSSTNTRLTICSMAFCSTTGCDRPSHRKEYFRGSALPHCSSAMRMTSSIVFSTNLPNCSRVMFVLNLLDDKPDQFRFPSGGRLAPFSFLRLRVGGLAPAGESRRDPRFYSPVPVGLNPVPAAQKQSSLRPVPYRSMKPLCLTSIYTSTPGQEHKLFASN